MNDTQEKNANTQALAELVAELPDDMRDIIAAQLIGTINGALIAHNIDQQKSA